MKIVHFSSGLGNQVFFYLFSKYLENKYPNQRIYGYYNRRWLVKHNGLEIDRVFDVTLPPHTRVSDFIVWLCRKLNGIGIKGLKATDENFDEKAIYFDGYYQDRKFFERFLSELNFRDFDINEKNQYVIKEINRTNSIAVHIRRGDYLLPQFVPMFGGICTDDYYKKAVEIIKEKIEHPHFFVFSNDIEWVKDNLPLTDATFVNHNNGSDSYMDMYLMSLCKGCIIANSSFSYWGAMLNKDAHVIIYPSKWNNQKTPDMFPKKWIGL